MGFQMAVPACPSAGWLRDGLSTIQSQNAAVHTRGFQFQMRVLVDYLDPDLGISPCQRELGHVSGVQSKGYMNGVRVLRDLIGARPVPRPSTMAQTLPERHNSSLISRARVRNASFCWSWRILLRGGFLTVCHPSIRHCLYHSFVAIQREQAAIRHSESCDARRDLSTRMVARRTGERST